MSDNDNGCGAAVAEFTASTELAEDFTLFQIEESLVLLAESAEEEGLTPEIERALTVYLEGAAEKRDRVADFIHFCEGMAELAKAEGKRLQARQKHFEATAERVSAMVLSVLDYLGVKKLEGRTNTLKKRKCPPSVRIIDEAKVPLRANIDETLTAAIITEQGGKEKHCERNQDCSSFRSQFGRFRSSSQTATADLYR